MASAAPSFCQDIENTLGRQPLPASGDGPALVAIATVPDSTMRGRLAISTLEKPRPTMASTLSRSISLRAIWLPSSGLSWSSSRSTVTASPPSFLPSDSMPSMKPSYWSCPTAATGPDRGPVKPILTSAWAAQRPKVAALTAMNFQMVRDVILVS